MGILGLIYIILGYMAIPHTIWKNKVIFGSFSAIFSQKLTLAIFLGWLLIPWWLLTRGK